MLKMELLKIILAFSILNFSIVVAATLNEHPEESPDLFEGDIRLPNEEEEASISLESGEGLAAGLVGEHYLWPNGRVPFEISTHYNDTEKQVIKAAMDTISKETCISFVPHGEEENWIVFRPGKECSSLVGRRRQEIRGQEITLDRDGCIYKGVIMHEILHALGLWHEQNRFDRDDHVRIFFENVIPAFRKNFDKHTTRDFAYPYDYDSIMHYGEQYFITEAARKEGRKTIVATAKGHHIGQRSQLSPLDIKKINSLYKCNFRSRSWPSVLFPILFPIRYMFAADGLTGMLSPNKNQTSESSPVPKIKLTAKLPIGRNYYEQGDLGTRTFTHRSEDAQHHNLTIPYTISADVDKPSRRKLQAAMIEISSKTCIKFQSRNEEKLFIFIRNHTSCGGDDDRQRKRKGKNISTGKSTCLRGKKGRIIALQQLLKGVGLFHGHANPDAEIVLDISNLTQTASPWNIHRPTLTQKAVRKIKRKYCRKDKLKVSAESSIV